MEFIENVEKNEYDKFLKEAHEAHFMQTSEFGEIRKNKRFIPHLVGIKDQGKLICAALLLEKNLPHNLKYYYVPRGYTIDYQNHDLLKTFTNYLYDYCKKNKAIFLKIDPGIKRYTIDLDGKKIDGEDNSKLIEFLKSIGYKHLGFNLGFEHEEPRFTFRINIDKSMDDVYKNFHATTRKVLNKGNQYNLKIYKGNVSDIPPFYETMIETAKREGIIQAPIKYYEDFYKIFNKHNMSDIYVAKANIDELKKQFKKMILETEKKEIKNSVEEKEKEAKLIKLKRIYNEIKEIDEKEITLASIITVKYKDKVWTVHGGNHSKLMSLNANYLIYYEIIKDANNDGFKIVDLFGTCGIANPDPTNPIYGIHNFKKRLGGEYTEFIGEFDLIINKMMYFLYQMYKAKRKKQRNKKRN